ncbi:DUF6033 family protein [Clostridioides difficile]|uniref:DUF6033 family protein n=1 Tax=Clostridioides difficile TaxID=1496 RepID=UPI0021C6DD5E|nr:DUF6033 family protein [Clostridioides difficile]UUV09566.1 DUF6033 family protein [Clostridioides difficile]HCU2974959.1 hypothetical protein [Clostridioides difficile]HCU3024512.1 hypothetical protein [Clostridioides difficile]
MITTDYSNYDQSFQDMVKKDFKEINNLSYSKVETLEDLRNTVGKSFRTEDLEKLMEKYDPKAYEEYSKFAKSSNGARTQRGLSYLSGWMDKVKKDLNGSSSTQNKVNDISSKNESKLSSKAQDFLKNLRSKYGDYDFLVGNSTDDLKLLSKSGSKEYSVIFSSAELERMANDEKYAQEKMQGVEGAVKMAKRIAEENGYTSAFGKDGENGTINKISIVVGDDGSTKIFAELEKTSDKQKERISKAREKRAEEKKAADKKAKEKVEKKNPYEKDDKYSVKRTIIEASSEEELKEKLKNIDWSKVSDSHSGDRFNFSV